MKNFLIVLALVFSNNASPQDLPNIVPPSPDATAFHVYGNTQTNNYTGSANISIPIWEIIEGDLRLPIYLKYTGGNGIKVEEIASWVGLGWTLNTGGAISRIIRGIADEDQDKTGFWKMTEIPVPNGNNHFIFNDIGNGLIDGEPDKFMYDFPGGSGSFFYDYDEGIHFKPKKNINVSLNVGIEHESISVGTCGTFNEVITDFKITDEYGGTYYFNEKERSNTITFGVPYTDTRGFPSTWYPSKIENLQGTASIDYEYDTYGYLLKRRQGSIPISGSMEDDVYMQTSFIGKRLSKIRFSNGSIEFIASTAFRKDLDGNKYLDRIIVRDVNDKVVRTVRFDYNYLTSNGQVPVDATLASGDSNRLILTSIEECDADDNCHPPYLFTYNTTKYLPERFSKAIDHWGYYNGRITNTKFEPKHRVTWYNPSISAWVSEIIGYSDREPDATFSIAGILEKIQYPTGGNTTFNYEAHTALHKEINRKSIARKEFLMWQGQKYPFEIKLFSDANAISTLTAQGIYNDSQCSLKIFIKNLATNETHTLTLDGVNYPNEVDLKQGHYEAWFELKLENGGTCTQNDPALINIDWTDEDSSPNTVVGGLRIKSISDFSGNGVPSKEKVFDYNNDIGITTGRINNAPKYYGLVYHRPLSGGSWTPINYQRYINSNAPLSTTQGSEVGYGKVSVYDSLGENGKMEYYYSTADDYPDIFNAVNPSNGLPNFQVFDGVNIYPYPKPEINSMDFLRGQLKKEVGYKKIDTIYSMVYMKEVYHDSLKYSIGDFHSIDDHIKNAAKAVRGLKVHNYPEGGSDFTYYDIYTGYSVPSKTIVKKYDGPNMLVETSEYEYDVDSYGILEHYIPIGEEIVSSDGTLLKSNTDFVFNRPSLTNAELDLRSKNALYLPLQKDVYKGGLKLSSQYTQYNNVKWPGLNLPESIRSAKGSNVFEDRIIFHDYYPDGNFKEISKDNGTHIFYVRGYNGQYPIAKIEKPDLTGNTTAQQVLIGLAETAADNDTDAATENSLRTALDNLRTGFPNSLVTTYTYDPLIGVTSMTDPKGYTVFYHYDDFNRLIEVRDGNGKLLSDHKYHYKDE